jgi:hypothetical protein
MGHTARTAEPPSSHTSEGARRQRGGSGRYGRRIVDGSHLGSGPVERGVTYWKSAVASGEKLARLATRTPAFDTA